MEWASATRWMGRRVLVTGASGFLGGAVSRLLLELGAEVYGSGRGRLPPPGIIAVRAHLPDDADEMMRTARPEVVFHLASPVDVGRDPALFARLRPGILEATDAVATACLRTGARLVSVGTCEEYGSGEAPFREDQAPRPVSAYSALKVAATAWVQALAQCHGLDATVLRPFRTYGPGDSNSLVAQACRAALDGTRLPLTDGQQVREWNHVDAMAMGIVAAGAHPGARGQVLNLGGGPRVSVLELVQIVFRLAEADPALIAVGALPRRAGEVDHFWGDHRRAEALWGPLPHLPLEDGLRDTLDGMRTESAKREAP